MLWPEVGGLPDESRWPPFIGPGIPSCCSHLWGLRMDGVSQGWEYMRLFLEVSDGQGPGELTRLFLEVSDEAAGPRS